MIRLALAIGFIAVFGFVGAWLILYLQKKYGDKPKEETRSTGGSSPDTDENQTKKPNNLK